MDAAVLTVGQCAYPTKGRVMPATEDRPALPPVAELWATPVTDFRTLPEPIRVEDTIAEKDVREAPDPDFGRDSNHEWMLRHIG